MIDVESLHLNIEDIQRIKHPLVGGIILFARNYQNKNQLKQLVSQIRDVKKDILIGVDHEGGRVQRFKDGFTSLPPMAMLGKIYNQDKQKAKDFASLVGWVIAKELGGCDIDFSFTPVLDVNYGASSVIGDRAFHEQISPVIELANNLIQGLEDGGMQAIGKHFPGHGFIREDTHLEKGEDKRKFLDIKENDLKVFISLINNGMKGIMPSHIIYSSCDSLPAGLSRFWLQDQLRDKLGFKGVIFSDDMSMKAAKFVKENIVERLLMALNAGCDMVLLCNSPKEVDYALTNIRWNIDTNSIARLAAMKLDNTKNKIDIYKHHSVADIQQKIKSMTN
jgi:beta-N-acetylhexosaminidase